tara:strand:- start:295 stop:1062 length:768 start_codon:yes stop_codon:yes gene_type:complete
MKILTKIFFIFILLYTTNLIAREQGQTEITTEDGVEVYQDEKYYLLKQNVKIVSDNFILNADNVKIDFDKSLYDIISLNANGNVKFNSSEFDMKGSGEKLELVINIQDLTIEGNNSILITQDLEMQSSGSIKVNNLSGSFFLNGSNSKLVSDNILIKAESIDGLFSNELDQKEISLLKVKDQKISYIKNNDTEMYAKKINFDNKTSIIELIDDVSIIRNGEKITGDYGTLDTRNNSYKIKSNDKTKVKVIIQNNE